MAMNAIFTSSSSAEPVMADTMCSQYTTCSFIAGNSNQTCIFFIYKVYTKCCVCECSLSMSKYFVVAYFYFQFLRRRGKNGRTKSFMGVSETLENPPKYGIELCYIMKWLWMQFKLHNRKKTRKKDKNSKNVMGEPAHLWRATNNIPMEHSIQQ